MSDKPHDVQPTDWTSVQRESAVKAYETEIAGLRRELDLAKQTLERTKAARQVRLPTPRAPERRQPGDVVRVIIPDTHGAKADQAALAAMLADIKTLDPHEVILLGDHVDCGGFLAQHLVMGYVAETTYSYEEDLEHANAFLDAVQSAAPRAKFDYLEGNHERRVETWAVTQTLRHSKDSEGLRKLYAPEHRLNLEKRGIKYYRQGVFYNDLPVPGVIKKGRCFFFHGISTSKNAADATQLQIAGNCVFGHTHRSEAQITRRVGTGIVGSWNPGCLCELQPLWQHTKPTTWTHGYAVQLVAPDGGFLHLNIPILDGKTHFAALFKL